MCALCMFIWAQVRVRDCGFKSDIYVSVAMCVTSMGVWTCVRHVCECGYMRGMYVSVGIFMVWHVWVDRRLCCPPYLRQGLLFFPVCVRIDGP